MGKEDQRTVTEASVTDEAERPYHLRLYVADNARRSLEAVANLKKVCEEHLSGLYEIEVIDLLHAPHRAAEDQILAIPTLIRRRPEPLKRIIGTLSNTAKVLIGLEIHPGGPDGTGHDREPSSLKPDGAGRGPGDVAAAADRPTKKSQ